MAKKKSTRKAYPLKKKMHAVGMKLKAMKERGVRHVKVFYTTKDGKANYRRIAITGALIAAAGAGIYMLRKHKKHGNVLHKKKK